MKYPTGIWLYSGRIGRVWSPAHAAAFVNELRSCGASGVLLCAEAIDEWRPSDGVLEGCTRILQSEGFGAHLYALHSRNVAKHTAHAAALRLVNQAMVANADGVMADMEESWDDLPEQAEHFMGTLEDFLPCERILGVTFYGTPTSKPRFPWKAILGKGWANYQLYERAGNRRVVRRAIDWARGHWKHVMPAVATYKRRTLDKDNDPSLDGPDRLDDDLRRMCLTESGEVDVPGVAGWSLGSLDSKECAVFKKWSPRFPG